MTSSSGKHRSQRDTNYDIHFLLHFIFVSIIDIRRMHFCVWNLIEQLNISAIFTGLTEVE